MASRNQLFGDCGPQEGEKRAKTDKIGWNISAVE